jgi:hypothetical protein
LPVRPDEAAASDNEVRDDDPQSVQAKLAELEASNQKLQFENLALRISLQRRSSRRSFERSLLVILGLWLGVLALVVGVFARIR